VNQARGSIGAEEHGAKVSNYAFTVVRPLYVRILMLKFDMRNRWYTHCQPLGWRSRTLFSGRCVAIRASINPRSSQIWLPLLSPPSFWSRQMT